ncbi:MAG: rhodanese-like domain-containing protein [Bacteroidota bacterium]
MLNLFKQILGGGPDLKALLEDGAIIVDVRSPQEYQGGHVAGSINIPVGEISSQISRLQKANKTIITCCASGMRSASAATILKNAGLEAVNGGPWTTVNKAQAEAVK